MNVKNVKILKSCLDMNIVKVFVQVGLIFSIAIMGSINSLAVADEVPVVIPRDEAPHDVSLEWWYYTGHLSGTDIFGKTHSYGYQMTFFRSGLGTFPLASAYVGNLAITDLNRGVHYNDSRISIQPDLLLPGGGYNIQLLDWNLNGKNGNSQISGGLIVPGVSSLSSTNYGLNLSMQTQGRVVLNGDQGVMPPNASGALDYYSFPNLKVSGSVNDNGLIVPVTGTSWFDHEFGAPSSVSTGWHWYAIELADGTKYNISLLKDVNNKTSLAYGTYIKADGTYSQIDPKTLADSDVGPTWTSPRTGVTYPMAEIVSVPGGQVVVTSRVNDQEMTLLGSTYAPLAPVAKLGGISNLTYSESDATVTGKINGVTVSGKAYMEIVPFSSLKP
ncbi:carotenoid 1,2-hydratase [Burkholderia alba]|uniref:carotenoid 1,2-hydratase n=1 Tax=Burkholderia alba TaxID=2683677 RepID=UPI002B052D5D|nr:carotenoid 1,2-hydratase [Burkholderia alba]